MQQTKRIKNPKKQRKMMFNAPAHIRHKLMAAPLSSELAASRGTKTLPVRKGDTVRIQRGDNKGFEGKVSQVDLKGYRIYLEGLTREKVDGTNIFISVHPSKVQIRNLNLDDKWRKNILERKKAVEKPAKEEKAKAKPVKKVQKPQAKIEEVVPEVAKEEAPAETISEGVEEKTPAKKTVAKKPAAKKEEAPVTEEKVAPKEEKKPSAKKAVAKPKAAAKEKAPAKAEKAPAKKAAAKAKPKAKAPKETALAAPKEKATKKGEKKA
jgi:large subunit ribosomal protein L24